MIKPEQIPDRVVNEARKAWLTSDDGAVNDWRKAIAAAINAWPGMEFECNATEEWAVLPLPQEKKQ